jgi:hypothetical protein
MVGHIGGGHRHLVDQLGVRIHRQVGAVAVETPVIGLTPMAGFGIDGGDDAVLGHPLGDAEDSVVALFDILAGQHGQQTGHLGHRRIQTLAIQRLHGQLHVAHQSIHQSLPGGGIVPVTRRLAHALIIIVAAHRQADLGPQIGAPQQHQALADGRAQLGHRVLGGHRVIQRRGIQHPSPVAQHARLSRHLLGVLEQPAAPLRGPQPVAHPHQHRRMERRITAVHTRRGLPAQVAFQAVHGLLIRQALMGLQQHHRGQHPGRHRRSPPRRLLVQVREIVIREQPATKIRQEPVNASQPIPQKLPGILEAGLQLRHA